MLTTRDLRDEFSVIPTTTEAHLAGYHRCLDVGARERRYFGLVEAPPIESSKAFVSGILTGGGVHMVVIDRTDQVVGWCDIMRHTRAGFEHGGRIGMGLLPEVRGRGLGELLLIAVLDAAREKGMERAELEVFSSNTAALSLYRRVGFVEEGRKLDSRRLDGRSDDDVLMVKWLRPF